MARWIRFSKQLQIIFFWEQLHNFKSFLSQLQGTMDKTLSLSLVVPLQTRISYSAILTHLWYISLLKNKKFALQSVPNSNSMFAQECNWVCWLCLYRCGFPILQFLPTFGTFAPKEYKIHIAVGSKFKFYVCARMQLAFLLKAISSLAMTM